MRKRETNDQKLFLIRFLPSALFLIRFLPAADKAIEGILRKIEGSFAKISQRNAIGVSMTNLVVKEPVSRPQTCAKRVCRG